MQEQHTPAPEIAESTAAPTAPPHPVNKVELLEAAIMLDVVEHFKQDLVTPLGHEVFVKCLSLALQYQSQSIITFLCSCPLSTEDGNSAKRTRGVQKKHAKKLFNLLYFEYADFFRSNAQMKQAQASYLTKIGINKNKLLLLAAISGNVDAFRRTEDIPTRASADYLPFIVYAAADDHAMLVPYLHRRGQNPHSRFFHENAMAAAIAQNANLVFDYLIKTDFDPNLELIITKTQYCRFPDDSHHLLNLTLQYRRYGQFIKLIKKGAILNSDLLEKKLLSDPNHLQLEHLEVMQELLALQSCDTVWSTLTQTASPNVLNKIMLCLLLTKGGEDKKIPKLFSTCLHKLVGNIPKRLLILAHILTYHTQNIAQPKEIRTIFDKALFEFSGISFDDNYNYEQVLRLHYQQLLVSLLKIRLEFIKLLPADIRALESKFSDLSTQKDSEFWVQYQAINQEIVEIMQKNLAHLNHSITFLNRIEFECVSVRWPNPAARENAVILSGPGSPRFNFSDDDSGINPAKRHAGTTLELLDERSPKGYKADQSL